MLSQSGFAKAKLWRIVEAKLLNMHTKALIRAFDKGGASWPRFLAQKAALHGRAARFIIWIP
jgi:hypothetical protein